MKPTSLTNVALLVLSAAVALLAAEGLVRLAGVGPRFGQLIFSRGIHTRTVDGVPLWSGARPRYDGDDVLRASRDPATFTILGLGDSIMYGVGLPKEATYLEQARTALARRAKRHVEILNLAVPGYNTMQENVVYKELDTRVRPDLVLVHYWIDDVHQYQVVAGHVLDLGNVSDADGRLVIGAIPLPAPVGDFLLVHSRLYDLLTQVVVAARRDVAPDDWTRVTVPLAEIQQRAQRAGGRVVVLASAALDSALPLPIVDLSRLQEFATGRGIEVIDLSQWLQGHRSEEIGMDMCHLNAAGHRLVGERLAEYLLERDLKP